VLYSEHFEDGPALYAQAAKLGLEGVVSKRADAPYRSGRGEHWHKVKCRQRDRFVVIGFCAGWCWRTRQAAPCAPGGRQAGLCGPRQHRMASREFNQVISAGFARAPEMT
jgi:hypothetical protein